MKNLTKGIWLSKPSPASNTTNIVADDNGNINNIAQAFSGVGNNSQIITHEEREANAKAMAASKEMLEALQSLLVEYDGNSDGYWVVLNVTEIQLENAKAAVKKATA